MLFIDTRGKTSAVRRDNDRFTLHRHDGIICLVETLRRAVRYSSQCHIVSMLGVQVLARKQQAEHQHPDPGQKGTQDYDQQQMCNTNVAAPHQTSRLVLLFSTTPLTFDFPESSHAERGQQAIMADFNRSILHDSAPSLCFLLCSVQLTPPPTYPPQARLNSQLEI